MKIIFFIGAVAIAAALLNRKRVMKELSNYRLGNNFTLDEFVVTSTGIDNVPDDVAITNLELLVKFILQPLRDYIKLPISINSGYRSLAVNAAIGGAATSQHKTGQAADIHVNGMTNQQIIDTIRMLKLPYDQIIDEQLHGSKWVHVSYNNAGGRRQWLTARDGAAGTIYTTIQKG